MPFNEYLSILGIVVDAEKLEMTKIIVLKGPHWNSDRHITDYSRASQREKCNSRGHINSDEEIIKLSRTIIVQPQ